MCCLCQAQHLTEPEIQRRLEHCHPYVVGKGHLFLNDHCRNHYLLHYWRCRLEVLEMIPAADHLMKKVALDVVVYIVVWDMNVNLSYGKVHIFFQTLVP